MRATTAFHPLGQGSFSGQHGDRHVFVDGSSRRVILRMMASRPPASIPIPIDLANSISATKRISRISPQEALEWIKAIVECSKCKGWILSQFDLQHSVIPLVRMLWLRALGQPTFGRGSAPEVPGSCLAHLREFARLIAKVGAARPLAHSVNGQCRIPTRTGVPHPASTSIATSVDLQSTDAIDRTWIAAFAMLPAVSGFQRVPRDFRVVSDIRASLLVAHQHISAAEASLERCSDAFQHRPGPSSKEPGIQAAFWQLFVAETCLLDIHRHFSINTTKAHGESESPWVQHALTEADLRSLHAGGQRLLMARVRLWSLDEAERLLQPELTLLSWKRPSDDVFRATAIATLDPLSDGAFKKIHDASPREEFLDPFWRAPALQTALERREARWFKPDSSKQIEKFVRRARKLDKLNSQADVQDGTSAERRLKRRFTRDFILPLARGFTITKAGLVMLAISWVMIIVACTKWITVQTILAPTFTKCLVFFQGLLFLAWVMRRELRLHLPRAFFGTGFIWLLSLLPLLEVIKDFRDVARPGGSGGVASEGDLYILKVGVCDIWLISLIGLGFGTALILMQVRGPRRADHSSIAGILTTLMRHARRCMAIGRTETQYIWGAMHGPRRACGDLIIATTVTLRSVIGAMWWGTMMFFSLAAFEVICPEDLPKVAWSIIPLSIWAVGLAFVSQLMWQDQFLTEPLGSDR